MKETDNQLSFIDEAYRLLAQISNKDKSLTVFLPDVLFFAKRYNLLKLEEFCTQELRGYLKKYTVEEIQSRLSSEESNHPRNVDMFVMATPQQTIYYDDRRASIEDVFRELENSKNCLCVSRHFVADKISIIEDRDKDSSNNPLTFTASVPIQEIFPSIDQKTWGKEVYLFIKGTAWKQILKGVRNILEEFIYEAIDKFSVIASKPATTQISNIIKPFHLSQTQMKIIAFKAGGDIRFWPLFIDVSGTDNSRFLDVVSTVTEAYKVLLGEDSNLRLLQSILKDVVDKKFILFDSDDKTVREKIIYISETRKIIEKTFFDKLTGQIGVNFQLSNTLAQIALLSKLEEGSGYSINEFIDKLEFLFTYVNLPEKIYISKIQPFIEGVRNKELENDQIYIESGVILDLMENILLLSDEKEEIVTETQRLAPIDVLLLTALHEEYEEVIKVKENIEPPGWQQDFDGSREYSWCKLRCKNGTILTVRATWCADMGGEVSAATAAKFAERWKPQIIAMSGVCAGNRKSVSQGDVIFADRIWNYEQGKITTTSNQDGGTEIVFKGDMNQFRLNANWKHQLQKLNGKPFDLWWENSEIPHPLHIQELWVLNELREGRNPRQSSSLADKCPDWSTVVKRLRDAGKISTNKDSIVLEKLGEEIIEDWHLLNTTWPPKPDKPKIVLAPMATGSAVREDEDIYDRLSEQMRKVAGLEMESSAIGVVSELNEVNFLIAKGVQDYGSKDKDDRYRTFAARSSAEWVMRILHQVSIQSQEQHKTNSASLAETTSTHTQLNSSSHYSFQALSKPTLSREAVLAEELSAEAKKLLASGAKGHGTYLLVGGGIYGAWIDTPSGTYPYDESDKTARGFAKWHQAFKDLQIHQLVKGENGSNEVFKVSDAGYKFYDYLTESGELS